jgi:RNA polymerase sigma factor (TIGR02999 family)
MSALIALLERAASGDQTAFDAAYALVYPTLKQIARNAKRRSSNALDAGTTSIVHDACLKLLHSATPHEEAHFYAIAAMAMRQILLDRLRRKMTDKRAVGEMASLDELSQPRDPMPGLPGVDLLALDQVLHRLEAIEPRLVRIVELRCFAELEHAEIGQQLGISERTVRREWRRARAFLWLQLQQAP